jgi:hypothetical protein
MLSYSVSRRTNVALTLQAGVLEPIDSPVARAVRLNGNLRVSRTLTRGLSGYIGYDISQNRVDATDTTEATNYQIGGVDFGLDFTRPLQLGRSTTLNLRTGLVRLPSGSGSTFQLTGGVSLDHFFGRSTWGAQLLATRDARFVQTYRNAVAYHGVSATIGGRVVGRVGSIFSANYSSGTINAASAVDFHSYSGSAMMRYDVRRIVATFVEYSAFLSDVGDTSLLPGQPTGRFGRHGVRAGLTFGVSPFERNR